MKKIHYILLIIPVIVGLVRLVYEYRAHKDELFAAAKFESRQRDVTKKGAPKVQIVNSVAEVERIFNNNLASCTPVNIATEDNTNYVYTVKTEENALLKNIHLLYVCNV